LMIATALDTGLMVMELNSPRLMHKGRYTVCPERFSRKG